MEGAWSKRTIWMGLLGIGLLAIFPLFLHLDAIPLFIFDEGRLANNALEMVQNGHWLVTHYDGKPDLWNTKPPLMIWLQALSMKALGFDLLAVRLPAALAGLATILALFVLTLRITRSFPAALAAGLVLLTTPGYIANHVTRTGDYDALLTLFSTLFLLFILRFTQTRSRQAIWLAMACFTLGVLTKGIVIFLFLPGLFLFLLLSRNLLPILRQPHFYFSLLASLALIAAYYLGREWASPGYLEAVMQNELGGRFLEVVEFHSEPWYFYFELLGKETFLPWVAFLPLTFAAAFLDPEKDRRPVWHFFWWNALVFLLILSFSQTKLYWYAVPAYPLLAIAVGAPIGLFLQQYFSPPRHAKVLRNALLISLFLVPYTQQVERSYIFKDTFYGWEQRQYANFMKEVRDWPGYTVVQTDYNAHSAFYVKAFQAQGQDLALKYPHELTPGDTILLCEEKIRGNVHERWAIEELTRRGHCGLYRVGKK
jgi:4-amino-4-deoxy-L-arabinose transferase-like glycosyltransferase